MRSSPSSMAFSFGPGPFTPAVKALVIANVVAFLLALIVPEMIFSLGLRPADVLGGRIWQPLTYMFLHGGISHILFNMLSLWMFGVELERMWGSAFFTRFYLVCGVGAAATTILLSLLAWRLRRRTLSVADGRRVRRDLRHPDGLRAVLPEPADLHVLPVSRCR